METPTLAHLATHGVQLRRHYSMPICGPTRAALLTGFVSSVVLSVLLA